MDKMVPQMSVIVNDRNRSLPDSAAGRGWAAGAIALQL
jgi:hypothetical protein